MNPIGVSRAMAHRDSCVSVESAFCLVRRIASALSIAVCVVALNVRVGPAQQATATTLISTGTGVYTNEQAARGRDVYAAACQGCHNAAGHSGHAFTKEWLGATLADLFAYLSTTMPKGNPESLAPSEYVELVAYLLKLNRMPAGPDSLPTDAESLRRIRIDTTATGR